MHHNSLLRNLGNAASDCATIFDAVERDFLIGYRKVGQTHTHEWMNEGTHAELRPLHARSTLGALWMSVACSGHRGPEAE